LDAAAPSGGPPTIRVKIYSSESFADKCYFSRIFRQSKALSNEINVEVCITALGLGIQKYLITNLRYRCN